MVSLLWLTGLAAGQESYTELFKQAATDTERGHYEQAAANFKAALAIRPGATEALNNLAVVYYQLHRYSEAFETADPIWKGHPEFRSAALITGMAAVQLDRPSAAIAPLEHLLAFDPANRDGLLALASARYALKDLLKAVEIYEREVSFQPSDAKGWYGVAICYEQMAEEASKSLSRIPGGFGYSKLLLAQYLQSVGGSKLAQEAFGEASVDPSASRTAQKKYQQARELAGKSRNAFERFVSLSPDSWRAALFLADIDRQHGDFTSAIAKYQKAAAAEPHNQGALLGLGTAYWEMGDFDHATSCLREVLRLNPQSQQATFELANIAVRRHQESEAIPLLKQYLAAQPDALAARADLGRAYAHLGRYKEAVAELTKASEGDERGEINYQLSLALRKLGRTQQAESALAKSTELRVLQRKREEQLHANH